MARAARPVVPGAPMRWSRGRAGVVVPAVSEAAARWGRAGSRFGEEVPITLGSGAAVH